MNVFARFVYLFYLEVAVCATLSLSLNMSPYDTVYSCVLLSFLAGTILGAVLLYSCGATMHI